jgi:hypothetical protein
MPDDSIRDSITDWLYTLACGLICGWILHGLYILAHMMLEWAGVTW